MPGLTPPKNSPQAVQAVIRESDFVWFVSLAEACEIHKKFGGRWFPKKFPVHRNETGHSFIDRDDGTCGNCRGGGRCKRVRLPAVDITPTSSPRAPKAIEAGLYGEELREMLEWLPPRLRLEMEKFDLGSLSREQMQHLAHEVSEVSRDHRVPWTQPDGSKIILFRTHAKMPLADIVREWLRRAKGVENK